MKTTIIFLCCLAAGCAGRSGAKTETASISVPTAVCGSCAKTIQQAVEKVDGVTAVKVDVDKKVAEVTFASERTGLGAIENAISDAGYTANAKKRNPEAFEKLDECCKADEP